MQLLINGSLLMVVGMGTVFAFLGIMVMVTDISAKVASKYAHLLPEDAPKKPLKKKKPAAVPASAADDGEILAVVTAAVHRYRTENAAR